MKSLIAVLALLASQVSIADVFVNNRTHIVVQADRRIGDVAVARWNADLKEINRKEAIRKYAEKKARFAQSMEMFAKVSAGAPYFPHLTNVSSASDILQEAKDAEATPSQSVAQTLKNWDNYSF